MEENSVVQKLIAEVFGTAFLVFIGVGSVPATLILAGKTSPFTMADLGVISFGCSSSGVTSGGRGDDVVEIAGLVYSLAFLGQVESPVSSPVPVLAHGS
jgi:hypothetical protein